MCFVPIGQYPDILNDSVFNDFHSYIVVLLGEKVCRAPSSIILKASPPRGWWNNFFLTFYFSFKNCFFCLPMHGIVNEQLLFHHLAATSFIHFSEESYLTVAPAGQKLQIL